MSPSTKSRRRGAVFGAFAGAACLVIAGCSSTAAKETSGGGGNGSDASFYKGKTLTMIVPSKPGGSFDAWGRLLAKSMGDHLHATIRVQNYPAGNTIVGQNTLAAARTDGLTFGWMNIPNDIELVATNTKGLNFSPADLPMIGAIPSSLSGLVVQAGTPYKTITDMQHATKPISALSVTSGANDLLLRTVLGVYGVKVRYITGYASTPDLAAGFLRGDGDVTSENMNTVVDAIRDGKARALALEGAAKPDNAIYQQLKDVPSLNDLLTSTPPSTDAGKKALTTLIDTVGDGQALAAPKGTPANRIAALAEAMKWSMDQSDVKAQAAKQSLVPGYVDGPTVHAKITTALQNASSLAPYVTH